MPDSTMRRWPRGLEFVVSLCACAPSAPDQGSSISAASGCVGACGTDESGSDDGSDPSGGATASATNADDDTGGSDPTGAGSTAAGTNDTATAGDDTDATGDETGCRGGPSTDRNGVAYVEIPGFTYEGGVERFDWTENFQDGGSMRHDFEATPEGNQCVVGYFVVDGPDGEEISAKLGGGPHNDDHPEWADTHDLGLIDFVGERARVRWEETHPDYEDAVEQDVQGVGDVRGHWVGAMGCKLNLDEDDDGEIDHIWYLAWVDPDGLDADGVPQNGWVTTLDAQFAVEDVGLKSPTVPYVTTIGESDAAQATMRIDEQGDGYEYDYIAYRSPVPCR